MVDLETISDLALASMFLHKVIHDRWMFASIDRMDD